MKTNSIKDALITLLQGLEYKSEPAFAKVTGYYIDSFNEYPLAVVLLGTTDSNYGSSAQNDRIDNFEINIIVSLEDKGKSLDEAQAYVYDLLDLVRDAIDKSQDLNGLLVYMNPTISNSGIIDFGAGEAVNAQVVVQCRYTLEIY